MELSRLLQEMRSRSLLGPLSGRSSRSRRKTAAVDGRYIETSETKTVTVADKTIVGKQISVTVPDVEYGSSPVPEGTFAGDVDGDETWAYTYSVDGGNTWSTEAPKTVGSYLVKAFL